MTTKLVTKSLVDNPLISQWVAFPADGVVRVRVGRVELGQGVATALLQIAADELDVRPDQVSMVAGDTRETPDEGFTSGSFSIEIGGVALRMAVSAARKLLLEEAAKLLQARPDQLSIIEGSVLRDGAPTDLTYWTLARAVDLDRPAADHAAPKAPEARRLVGVSMPRVDLPEKVAGGGFIHDMAPAGLLHGRVLHPVSRHRTLEAIDEARLAAAPGVVKVVRDGSFLGILAEREEQAVAALALAERLARWSPGQEAPADPVAGVAAKSPEPQVMTEKGAPAGAQGRRIALTVSRGYIAHGSMAPSCALARWTDGRVAVWTHGQGSHPQQGALAIALKVPVEAVDVIHVPGAGCYGHNGADDVALDAALLARAVPGRPVRVLWTRGDEMGVSPLGTGQVSHLEAVLGAGGRIEALTFDIRSQPFGQRPGRNGRSNLLAATYLADPAPPPLPHDIPDGAERNAAPIYDIPNVHVQKRTIPDLPFRVSSLRTLGAYVNVFGLETLMDDLAEEAGQDPVAFRLAHLSDMRARAVIEKAAAMAGWPGPAPGSGNGSLGLGFARYKNKSAYCAVVVRIDVDPDLRVTHAWSAVDAGEAINPDGIVNQVEGGLIQATSWALKEAARFDGDAVVSRDWDSYPILRFSEVPAVEIAILNRPDLPPIGTGEASQGPTAAAIGNALKRAIGVRVPTLPLTREAILAAMG